MPVQRSKQWLRTNRNMLVLLAVGLGLQVLVYGLDADMFASPRTAWITVVSGLAGVCSVVLCAQGRIATFAFGFIQIITYLWLSWQERLWAEVGMNIFYLLSQFYGIFFWRKRYTTELQPRRLSRRALAWVVGVCVVLSVACGWLLQAFTNDSQPWLDAFTTIPAIAAQILMVMAYREQWGLWLVVDMLAMVMWCVAGNYALAVLYLFWCVNCLYGWWHWGKSTSSKTM